MKQEQNNNRLAKVEASIANHEATFKERERAETQAQTERQLAAAAVQDALKEASATSGKALEAAAKAQAEALQAALKNANELELERVAKVGDKVADVKEAARLALEATDRLSENQDKAVKEVLDHHNELLNQMKERDNTYQSKDIALVTKEAFDKRHVDDLKRIDDAIGLINNRLAAGGGEKTAKERVSASVYGWVIVAATCSGGLVALIIHFIGG